MARASDSFFLVSVFRDQTFQMRQIRRVILLAGLFVIQSTLVLGFLYHFLLGELVAGTSPMLFASDELANINEQIPGLASVLGRWIIIMLVINLLLTAAVAYYITRKLGSPLLAIRRVLNEISEGNLDVRLRKGDNQEFSDIADALNLAVESMQEKISQAQREAAVVDMRDDQPVTNSEEIRQALSNCRIALEHFNTGHPGEEGNGDSSQSVSQGPA